MSYIGDVSHEEGHLDVGGGRAVGESQIVEPEGLLTNCVLGQGRNDDAIAVGCRFGSGFGMLCICGFAAAPRPGLASVFGPGEVCGTFSCCGARLGMRRAMLLASEICMACSFGDGIPTANPAP